MKTKADTLREQVEALGPLAIKTWREGMEDADKWSDRLRAADQVMARLVPIASVHEHGLTVNIQISREERAAIETVAREVGVFLPELPALPESKKE